jgi:spermidine synthase
MARSTAPDAGARGTLALLYFIVGFVALGVEVLWTRYLGLFLHAEAHTYALTLGVVLAGIVLGSLTASGWLVRAGPPGRMFGLVCVLNGIAMLALTLLPAPWWRERAGEPWLVFLGMLVPSALSGAAFPLAIRMRVASADEAGAGTGTLLAVNTLGGIAGSLVAGFVLLPTMGLQTGLLVLTGLALAGGFVAWLRFDPGLGLAPRVAMIAISALIWTAIPMLSPTRIPRDFLGEHGPLVDWHEGLTSNLAVIRNDGVLQLEIDRWWQGQDKRCHQLVVGHLPMLLHPDARHVLVVGIGTGQTASRFLLHPVERLDCVDIEPALFDFVRRHFGGQWMDDPRTRLVLEDGRSAIAHARETYDVVSLEVGQIFRPGAASFYTREFYELVRARLAPGGLVTQFVPVPFFTPDQFRSAIATFLEVFPRSVLWYNTSELLLVGFADDVRRVDVARVSAFLEAHPAVASDLEFSHWGGAGQWLRDPPALLAGFLAGPEGLERLAAGGSIYHDDRPVLDYAAAGAWLRPTHEVEIVRLIGENVDPIERMLAEGTTGFDLEKARSMRKLNLGDVVASSLIRQVGDARGGDPAGAVARMERAVEWNPESAEAHRLLADSYLLLGRTGEAEPRYLRAIAIDSTHARAHAGLALVLHQTRRLEAAIGHYERAADARPWDPNVRAQHGCRVGGDGALHRGAGALRAGAAARSRQSRRAPQPRATARDALSKAPTSRPASP